MIDFVNPANRVLRSSALTGVLVESTGLLEGIEAVVIAESYLMQLGFV